MEELAREIGRAVEDLDSLLAGCSGVQAAIRCGGSSRTVSAIANHVADWLQFVAESSGDLGPGAGWACSREVIDEIDATFAKASAARTLNDARSRLTTATQLLGASWQVLDARNMSLLTRWALEHVREHSAEIRAALLAASGTSAH